MSQFKSNNSKANKIRTHLLLKCESEIENFKTKITKINSISAKKLYELYSDIEIKFVNPCEFFSIERNFSINIMTNNSLNIKDFEQENSPILDLEYKFNKKLISDRKNKIFYEKIKYLDTSSIKLSDDTNDTSTSLNERNRPLEIKSKGNNSNNSIKFLRQIVKNFIKRKKHNRNSKSFYSNHKFKSQKDLSYLVLKNSKKKYPQNKLKSTKIVNKSVKKLPSFINSSSKQVNQLIHSNSFYFQNNHLKNQCKDLFLQNNNTMFITCNGPSFNRRTFKLMNIQFEKDKLKLQKKETSKKIFSIKNI